MTSATWRSEPAELAANIRYTYYPAGHMMYIDPASAQQLKADLASFYAGADADNEKSRRSFLHRLLAPSRVRRSSC